MVTIITQQACLPEASAVITVSSDQNSRNSKLVMRILQMKLMSVTNRIKVCFAKTVLYRFVPQLNWFQFFGPSSHENTILTVSIPTVLPRDLSPSWQYYRRISPLPTVFPQLPLLSCCFHLPASPNFCIQCRLCMLITVSNTFARLPGVVYWCWLST